MDEITDPRIREIMAKLNKSTTPGVTEAEAEPDEPPEPESPRPPLTLEEFLAVEKLDEWPQRITSENLLDLSAERDLLGSKDMIQDELRKATMLDMAVLNDLHNRLQDFEDRINAVGDQMIVEPTEELESPLPMSVSRAFLTEPKDNDVALLHPSRKKKKSNFKDAMIESRQRSVEYCSFPGYRQGELTDLPGSLEGPQLLNRITKAQDFNPGFKKFWKKIFQSEASVAMMQDSFWWFFIQNFEKDKKEDQYRLFSRIADSFVALFTSVHPEIKDKVFSAYSDCLSQAIFVGFKEAFPESDRHFQDDFKKQLTGTTGEWVTGIRPTGESWRKWDMKRLQLRTLKQPITDSKNNSSANVTDVAVIQNNDKQGLDMTEFHRSIQQLGAPAECIPAIGFSGTMAPLSREVTKATEATKATDGTKATDNNALVPVPSTTMAPMIVSSKPVESRSLIGPIESSKVGAGPEMERVMFNIQGQSPLVAHFLHMRQLRSKRQPGRRVRRTQIAKEPQETKTYRELINETKIAQNTLSKEYHRICDITQSEIYKIEKQQRAASRRIEQLQKEMNNCRTSMEVKLLGEHLLESAREGGGFGTQEPTELKALMKRENDDD